MKNKKEQIEEMAKCMGEKNFLCADDCENCIQIPCKCKLVKQSKLLYKSGYRKAAEVIDELVKNIMTDAEPFLSNMSRNLIRICASKMKKELAAEMRQEVK